MEENQTQVTTEETAPQVETEETATEVITETEEQPTTVEPNSNDDAEQQTSEEDEQTEQIGESNTDLAPFLSVRFNHETRELTQTEAQSYAQKGLQAEPIFAKLRYLAAQEGKKSVKEFVEALETTAESARLENIKSQLVDDGNAELLESIVAAEQQKFREAAGVIEEDEKKAFASEYENENSRLADEFIALQK
jgi:hypothetical protein